MLTSDEILFFIDVISDDTKQIREINNKLKQGMTFIHFIESIKISAGLLINCLLDHSQQVITFFLIYLNFSKKCDENPFVEHFIFIIQIYKKIPNFFSPCLIYLIKYFLTGQDIPASCDSLVGDIASELRPPENTEDLDNMIMNVRTSISPCVVIQVGNDNKNGNFISHKDMLIDILLKNQLETSFHPLLNVEPSLMSVSDEELLSNYINEIELPELYDNTTESYCKYLFNKSLDKELTNDENTAICGMLKHCPNFFPKEIKSKEKIEYLISYNFDFSKNYFNKFGSYFEQQILKLPLTLKSSEIVKIIIESSQRQDELLSEWVSLSTSNMNSDQNHSKILFCNVMIYFLEKGRTITEDLKASLKNFCIDFNSSGIPQAQNLYQLL